MKISQKVQSISNYTVLAPAPIVGEPYEQEGHVKTSLGKHHPHVHDIFFCPVGKGTVNFLWLILKHSLEP